ncbi:MAG: homocysteine S-methyltransferase family protein [Lachnospiraceae bacterium]|nr:homocysteine S-methyltransferase family protein [Lachnospiraceae bacterium]
MTKQEFWNLCEKHPIYLDGATGSNLIKRGMPAGVCPESWILDHRDIMLQLQREYVEAGSDIIYAPTFTSNRVKLQEYGLEDRIREINESLVRLSKEAAGDKAYVAGDITMTGVQLQPIGPMDFEELIMIYKEQIEYQVSAGIDLIVVETMMSLQETRAAVIAAREVCDLPVIATMTFEADGRSLYGTDARTAAVVLSSLGVAAIGANCSTGPDQMLQIIADMASVTDIPIITKPNAGLPSLAEDGSTVYDMDAETFSREMIPMIEAGASILGGCCGTDPTYIRKLKEKTSLLSISHKKNKKARFLASERSTLEFYLDDPFMVVGERINPTGKKKLQAELREGRFDLVTEYAEQQELSGARILDINMGMNGIDEKDMMAKAIQEVCGVTSLPLSIDSSHVDVIEEALRRYPGRALINSISLEKIKIEKLLPVARKYGAMFILLPLSDAGLPKDLAEKISIIKEVEKRALEMGMRKEDIIVDGLVATVGANKNAAIETLETIRFCKENGLATICGLSNISFGLPERSFVNAAFLTMAIQAGLTMAIANPNQNLLMASAFASDLLLHKEESDIRYIEFMNQADFTIGTFAAMENTPGEKSSGNRDKGKSHHEPQSITERLREAVLKGNRKQIVTITKDAMANVEPQMLLNEILLPAINEVGDLFDKGKYFLPQLISSAEAMKLSIEYLEPFLLQKDGKKEMPAIVIATVQGDIHDIGKNLVALMLKNHGFKVIDLGKDVSREAIVDAAIEHHAKIIALSALMTTTMQEMKKVIQYAREKGIDAKIIIGGAVITQGYADEIGADGYSKDAAEAVILTKRLLGIHE